MFKQQHSWSCANLAAGGLGPESSLEPCLCTIPSLTGPTWWMPSQDTKSETPNARHKQGWLAVGWVTPEPMWDHLYKARSFPGGSVGKECLQCRRPGFNPWLGKIR